MSNYNTYNAYTTNATLSVREAADLIIETARAERPITYALMGEPGIGKTSQLSYIVGTLGYERGIYFDCPTLDLSDLGVPVPNHETKTTNFYFNEAWGLHNHTADNPDHKPAVIVFDEYSKAMDPIRNVLHPAMTFTNGARRLGSLNLHRNTSLFITGNLSSDGVGDVWKGHTLSRVTTLNVRKQYRDELKSYAAISGWHPLITVWIEKEELNPCASYTDPDFASYSNEQKEMVYWPSSANPSRKGAYVCPRSLEAASHILWARDHSAQSQSQSTSYASQSISQTQLHAALEGTVGRIAASKLLAFAHYADEMPSARSIVEDPRGTRLPASPVAQIMTAQAATTWLAKGGSGLAVPQTRVEVTERIGSWMTFMDRLPKEMQALFVQVVRNGAEDARKQGKETSSPLAKLWSVVTTTKAFQEWAMKNNYLY